MQRHTPINRALKPHLLKKPHKSLVHGIEVSSITKKSIFMLIFWSAHAGLLQGFMKTTDFPLLLINARMLWEWEIGFTTAVVSMVPTPGSLNIILSRVTYGGRRTTTHAKMCGKNDEPEGGKGAGNRMEDREKEENMGRLSGKCHSRSQSKESPNWGH